MAFSEIIREQVRRKAAFRCCRCQNLGGVEAHHIIPQSESGPDTFENAAPLCPTCHAEFGGNPDKRKEIRQMRDWWYEKIEAKYGSPINYELFADMSRKLDEVQKNQMSLDDLKQILKESAINAIDHMTMGTVVGGATGITEAAAVSLYKKQPPFDFSSRQHVDLSGVGGDGGDIFIFAKEMRGSGSIDASGGDGAIGGKGGHIHVQTDKNSYKGKVRAKGGKGIKPEK